MAAKPLTIRCKTKSGHHILNQLTSISKVQDLCEAVATLTGQSVARVLLLKGFPPKPVDLSNKSASLNSVGIMNGDVLIVEEKAVPPTPVVSSPVVATIAAGNVQTEDAILMRHVIPADNSCLFNSIAFCISGGSYEPTCATNMRRFIADTVAANPEYYSAAILGKSNADYCQWICNDQTWGGAIEVSILSRFYEMEIVVVDTQHVMLNRFGENEHYDNFIMLLYDGIHYDPLVMESVTAVRYVKTVFSTNEEEHILFSALEIAQEAKQSHQFTDVSNFTLRCLACNKPLNGQVAAQQHAEETGHINFGEVISHETK